MDKIPSGLGIFPEIEEIVWRNEKMPIRIMPYNKLYQSAVTYEFWDTKYVYIRNDYGFFDWQSDLGGFLGTLTLVASSIIGLIVTNGPHVFTSTSLVHSSGNVAELENQAQLDDPHCVVKKKNDGVKMDTSDDVQKDCCMFARFRISARY